MFNPADIHTNMSVRDRDGERLGTVTAVDAGGFFIGKSSLFARDYRVAFSDVTDIDGDDVYLREDLASLPGVSAEFSARSRATTRQTPAPLEHDLTGGLGVAPPDSTGEPVRTQAPVSTPVRGRVQERGGDTLRGSLGLGPRDLEEARMDSAKFQDHGRYDVGAKPVDTGRERRREALISDVEPSVVAVTQPPVVVERRASVDDEDTVRRDAPADRDPNTRR